jgi:hypothetical protein|tara:strand:+ start:290 stop:856 length:567 start_codon:yes stop_codon:yes gene_type:complete
MARSIGSNFSTQISSSSVRPFYAVNFNYSTPLRLWTGHGNITIDSEIYTGSQSLMNIGQVNETAENKANGIAIGFSGIPTSLISSALTETGQGISVEVYFGVLTTTSNAQAIVDTPYQIFAGFVDIVSIAEQGETAQITFTIENKLISLERPTELRYTDQDQKHFFPNDKGLEFVDDLQDKEIVWGGG